MYVNLERIAHEVRNSVMFTQDDSGFKGSAAALEFYAVLFDYAADAPNIFLLLD